MYVNRSIDITTPPYMVAAMTLLNGVSVPINGVTLVAIFSAAGRANKPNLRFLASLTATDLVAGVPFYVRLADVPPVCEADNFGATSIYHLTDVLFQGISLWTIAVMAIDHYFAICKPLHYPIIMTSRVARWVMVAVWIGWCIASTLPFTVVFVASIAAGVSFCDNPDKAFLYAIGVALCTSLFAVGTLLTIILYTRVFIEVGRFHRANGSRRSSECDRACHLRSVMASVKTGVLMLGGFLVFWLPMLVIFLRLYAGLYSQVTYDAGRLWLHINTFYDPFIYAIRIPEIRQGYVIVWTKFRKICHPCNRNDP